VWYIEKRIIVHIVGEIVCRKTSKVIMAFSVGVAKSVRDIFSGDIIIMRIIRVLKIK